jgi:hypothetical protein
MARAGEAVVADDAVGDEVFGARRDVVEAHGLPEGLDADNAQLRVAFDGLVLQVQLASDCRTEGVKETKMLVKAAFEPNHKHRLVASSIRAFKDVPESEAKQATRDPTQNLPICIRKAKDGLTKAARRVENSSQKTC